MKVRIFSLHLFSVAAFPVDQLPLQMPVLVLLSAWEWFCRREGQYLILAKNADTSIDEI